MEEGRCSFVAAASPRVQYDDYRESLVVQVQTTRQNLLTSLDTVAESASASESKPESNSSSESTEKISVFLRIRPFLPHEKGKSEKCIEVIDSQSAKLNAPQISSLVQTRTAKFSFTRVFGAEVGQTEVFEGTAKRLIGNFLKGTNCLLFTYGVTNSGKTYTIQGSQSDSGILPRALEIIVSQIGDRLVQTATFKPVMHNHVERLASEADRLEQTQLRQQLLASSGLIDAVEPAVGLAESSSSKSLYTTASSSLSSLNSYSGSTGSITELVELSRVGDDSSGFIEKCPDDAEFSIWVSFAEVYNDMVYDLLIPVSTDGRRKVLKVSEDQKGKAYVKGLRQVFVRSVEEALKLLKFGQRNLQIASTKSNHQSSRSERCSKTGTERLQETGKINTSLLILGRCLAAVRRNQTRTSAQSVVPFRESRLTRLLQEYLVGKGRIQMMVNVSQSSADFDETMHVLKFSALAKQITSVDDARVLAGIKRRDQRTVDALPQLSSVIKRHKMDISARDTMAWAPAAAAAAVEQETSSARYIEVGETETEQQPKQELIKESADATPALGCGGIPVGTNELENDEFDTTLGADQEEILAQMRQYYEEREARLSEKIMEQKRKMLRMESDLRKEICDEMAIQMDRIERRYSQIQRSQQETAEDLAEKRIELYVNSVKKQAEREKQQLLDQLEDLEEDDDESEDVAQQEDKHWIAEEIYLAEKEARMKLQEELKCRNEESAVERDQNEFQQKNTVSAEHEVAAIRCQLDERDMQIKDLNDYLEQAGEEYTKAQKELSQLKEQLRRFVVTHSNSTFADCQSVPASMSLRLSPIVEQEQAKANSDKCTPLTSLLPPKLRLNDRTIQSHNASPAKREEASGGVHSSSPFSPSVIQLSRKFRRVVRPNLAFALRAAASPVVKHRHETGSLYAYSKLDGERIFASSATKNKRISFGNPGRRASLAKYRKLRDGKGKEEHRKRRPSFRIKAVARPLRTVAVKVSAKCAPNASSNELEIGGKMAEKEEEIRRLREEVADLKQKTASSQQQQQENNEQSCDGLGMIELEQAKFELETKLEQIGKELAAKNGENLEFSDRIAQLTAQCQERSGKVESLETNLVEKEENVCKLEKSVEELLEQEKLFSTEAQMLREQLSSANSDKAELVSKIASVEKEAGEKREQIQQLNEQLQEKEQQLIGFEQVEKDREAVQDRLAEKEQELSTKEQELIVLKEKLEKSVTIIDNKEKEVRHYTKEAGRQAKEIGQLREQLNLEKGRSRRVEEQNKEEQQKTEMAVQRGRNSVELLNGQLAQLAKDRHEFETQAAELRAEKQMLEQRLTGLETEKSLGQQVACQLQQELHVKLQELVHAKNENCDIKNQKANLDERLNEVAAELKQKENDSTQLRAKEAQLAASYDNMKTENLSKSAQLTAERQTVTELQQALAASKSDLKTALSQQKSGVKDMERTQVKMEEMIEELRARNCDLDREVKDKILEADDLSAREIIYKEELDAKTSEVEGIEKELTEVKGKFAEMDRRDFEAKATITRLRQEVERKNGDLSRLSNEVSQLRIEQTQSKVVADSLLLASSRSPQSKNDMETSKDSIELSDSPTATSRLGHEQQQQQQEQSPSGSKKRSAYRPSKSSTTSKKAKKRRESPGDDEEKGNSVDGASDTSLGTERKKRQSRPKKAFSPDEMTPVPVIASRQQQQQKTTTKKKSGSPRKIRRRVGTTPVASSSSCSWRPKEEEKEEEEEEEEERNSGWRSVNAGLPAKVDGESYEGRFLRSLPPAASRAQRRAKSVAQDGMLAVQLASARTVRDTTTTTTHSTTAAAAAAAAATAPFDDNKEGKESEIARQSVDPIDEVLDEEEEEEEEVTKTESSTSSATTCDSAVRRGGTTKKNKAPQKSRAKKKLFKTSTKTSKLSFTPPEEELVNRKSRRRVTNVVAETTMTLVKSARKRNK